MDLFDPYFPSNCTAHEQKSWRVIYPTQIYKICGLKGSESQWCPKQIKFCHCTRVNICQAEHEAMVGICTAEAFNGLSQDYPYNCQVFENK